MGSRNLTWTVEPEFLKCHGAIAMCRSHHWGPSNLGNSAIFTPVTESHTKKKTRDSAVEATDKEYVDPL